MTRPYPLVCPLNRKIRKFAANWTGSIRNNSFKFSNITKIQLKAANCIYFYVKRNTFLHEGKKLSDFTFSGVEKKNPENEMDGKNKENKKTSTAAVLHCFVSPNRISIMHKYKKTSSDSYDDDIHLIIHDSFSTEK